MSGLASPGLDPGLGPQPRICIRGNGLPASYCTGANERSGPPSAPFSITKASGIRRPLKLMLQGLLEDDGAANTEGMSVTNTVLLCVE